MEVLERNIILNCHLDELPLSEELTNKLASNKIYSIKELLELKVHEMLLIPGFSYHNLMEITKFLQEHEMNHLLIHE